MSDPKPLRARAAEMHDLALRIRDDEPGYAAMLVERAEELEAQATAIEKAADSQATNLPDEK